MTVIAALDPAALDPAALDPAALDAWINTGTALLGIPVQPEWREAVRQNLRVSFTIGALVLDFPLPDDSEPAPVFSA